MQLFECLEQIWSNDTLKRHAVLIGEGGSGKTTQLKKLWYDLSHNSALNAPIPIYVPLYGFNGSDTYIQDYIIQEYCGHSKSPDTDQTRKNDLLSLFKQTDDSSRRFVLLLDGINEAQNWNEIITEINYYLSNCKNLQIVISSRYKLNDFNDFTQLQVKPLTVDFVKNKLKENPKYKDYQFSDKLLSLLTNPMYLAMFLGLGLDIPEIETKNIISAGEIFKANNDRLVKSILYNLKKSEESNYYKTVQYCLKYLLPYFAHSISKISFTSDEFFNVLEECNSDLENRFGKRIKCIRQGSKNADVDDIVDNLLIPQHLIEEVSTTKYEDSLYKFSHENYLQFYTALHYYNEMKFCSGNQAPECLTNSLIDENLLSWIGEIGKEHKFADKNYLEDKDALHLEKWLHNHCEVGKSDYNGEELARATRNVIEIMKVARKNYLTADYSCLDLTLCDFYGCSLPNSNFQNAKINKSCFVSDGHSSGILALTISPDKTMLASVGRDGLIKIWDAETTKIIKTIKYSRFVSDSFSSLRIYIFISSDNKQLTLFIDKKILIWQLNLFDEVQINEELTPKQQIVNFWYVASSCNNDKYAIADGYGNIRILCAQTLDELHFFKINGEFRKLFAGETISFSEDGNRLSVINQIKESMQVSVIDLHKKSIQQIKINSILDGGIVFSRCGGFMMLYTNSPHIQYQIFSISDNDISLLKEVECSCAIINASFDESKLIILLNSGAIETIDFLAQTPSKNTTYICGNICSVPNAFSSDGEVFVYLKQDNTMGTYNITTCKTSNQKHSYKNLIWRTHYGLNEVVIVYKNCISVFNTLTNRIENVFSFETGCPGVVSRNGTYFILNKNNEICVKNSNSFKCKKISIDNLVGKGYFPLIACSEDASLLAVFDEIKNNIHLIKNGNCYKTISVDSDFSFFGMRTMVFSPNNQYIALKNYARIGIWNSENGDLVFEISNAGNCDKSHSDLISSIAFSENTILRFVDDTHTIYDIDIATKNVYKVSQVPYGICNDSNDDYEEIKLSNEGNYLIIRPHTSNSVLLYDIDNGKIYVPLSGVKFTRKMALVKDYMYSEREKTLITPLNNSSIAITHTDTSKTFYYTCLDSVNIVNSDFSNTDMSDELKKLLEMNGGIVN